MGVNFSDFLIKGKEISFNLVRNSSHPSSSYQGSTVIIAEKTTDNNVSR